MESITIQNEGDEKAVVMIVDDDRGPRESMRLVLESHYTVHAVESVDEGLALLDTVSPDCIVMDIRMPGRDGIEGLKAIRKRGVEVPVIMCTAYASLDTAQQAIRLEANDYIKKPYKAKDLLKAIKKQMSRHQLRTVQETVVKSVEEIEGKLAGELGEVGMAASALVHDLRNPLSAVLGSVYLLDRELNGEEGGVAPERADAVQEYLQIINKNLANCKDLTGTWKSITHAQFMNYEALDIAEIISYVFSQNPVDRKGQSRLLKQVGPPVNRTIMADRNQLQRLLMNLVQNAVQATDPESGEVTVEWAYEKDELHLSVRDNGVGIDPENKMRILEPFFTEGTVGGTGLGLFIVKRIAGLHKGALEIMSEPGNGSTFKVTLPLNG